MNLVAPANDTVESRIVRGPLHCDLCDTSTKLGFLHGTLRTCINCHFEVVEKTLLGV